MAMNITKKKADRRSVRISARVTPGLYKQITKFAKRHDLTQSDVVSEALLRQIFTEEN